MLNVSTTWRIAGVAIVVLAAALPLAGRWWRADDAHGCALDGLPLVDGVRVRVEVSEHQSHSFCSIKCAELWLDSSGERPRKILVMDEVTGAELDAAQAFYVRSGVVTHTPTGDRRHAFARRADARAHAETFRGRELTGSEKPFAAVQKLIEN